MIETSEQAFVDYWCNLVLGFISAAMQLFYRVVVFKSYLSFRS